MAYCHSTYDAIIVTKDKKSHEWLNVLAMSMSLFTKPDPCVVLNVVESVEGRVQKFCTDYEGQEVHIVVLIYDSTGAIVKNFNSFMIFREGGLLHCMSKIPLTYSLLFKKPVITEGLTHARQSR